MFSSTLMNSQRQTRNDKNFQELDNESLQSYNYVCREKMQNVCLKKNFDNLVTSQIDDFVVRQRIEKP